MKTLRLAGCDPVGTVWKLIPEEGVLWVGPDASVEGGQTWFQTSDDDVNVRSCTFHDTYTFFPNGDFKYETNGDLWPEDFWDGLSTTGCLAGVDLPEEEEEEEEACGSGEKKIITVLSTSVGQEVATGDFA